MWISLQEVYSWYTIKMLGCIIQTKCKRKSRSPKISEIQQIQNLKIMKRGVFPVKKQNKK